MAVFAFAFVNRCMSSQFPHYKNLHAIEVIAPGGSLAFCFVRSVVSRRFRISAIRSRSIFSAGCSFSGCLFIGGVSGRPAGGPDQREGGDGFLVPPPLT